MTPRRDSASICRIWSCRSAGNWSMIRSTLDGDGDGLEIAHLADEDDVGILAQGGAERVLERAGVAVHLALVDEALLVLVDELDRVLDGDDVIGAVLVHVVDERRQRRRLARAGRAGDDDEALRQVAELEDA